MRSHRLPLAGFLALTLSAPTGAQCLEWSGQFAGPGANAPVWALTEFAGELYAGGQFEWLAGEPVDHIARWDGSRWRPVGGGLNDKPRELLVFDDGGGPALFATGDFTLADGAVASRVARWDGLRWSPLVGSSGEGLSAPGYGLAAFDDGSGPALWVVGSFGAAGGLATAFVARWDGADWQAGYLPTLQAGGGIENALAHDDGSGAQLYVSGTSLLGGIQRWDGSGWSAVGTGAREGELTVFDDGGGDALYVSGALVERWDGSNWTAVGDPAGQVHAARVQGSELYIGGGFTSVSGVNASSVARWDGAQWSKLPGMVSGDVLALGSFDDGGGAELFAGGIFSSAGGNEVGHIASSDGAAWSKVGDGAAGLPHPVRALAVYDDGSGAGPRLYAGEEHQSNLPGRLAAWDGTEWTIHEGPNWPTDALAVYDDGGGARLYAGGRFGWSGNVQTSYVSSWDGASWAALGSGVDGRVRALGVYDPGGGARLYAGGGFTTAGGLVANRIAGWDGAQWSALGSGVTGGPVHALLAHDDGSGPSLFAGGGFTAAGGVSASCIARWDGASWSALGAGFDNLVKALIAFDDGSGTKLYAGGEFTQSGGVPLNNVAVWDGTGWSEVAGGVGEVVNTLSVLDEGQGPRLFAFGRFGVSLRLDGNAWTALPQEPDENVYASIAHDDGVHGPRLYLGGEFSYVGPLPSDHMTAWGPGCDCPPTPYCTAGTTGHGCTALMEGHGRASRSEVDGFRLSAAGVEGDKFGLLFWGTATKAAPWGPGSSSYLCVAAPVLRTQIQSSGGASGSCDGELSVDFNTWMAANPTKAPPAGTLVHSQAWFRDGLVTKGTSLSDALSFPICP